MLNNSRKLVLGIGILIILFGGIIPVLPKSWLSGLPTWIINLSIFCGAAVILLNIVLFFQEIDEFVNKKKKIK